MLGENVCDCGVSQQRKKGCITGKKPFAMNMLDFYTKTVFTTVLHVLHTKRRGETQGLDSCHLQERLRSKTKDQVFYQFNLYTYVKSC